MIAVMHSQWACCSRGICVHLVLLTSEQLECPLLAPVLW